MVGEVITAIKDICVAGSAMFAAYVAWLGLKTWKRELLGNAGHEQAKRLYRLVLNVREAIRDVRNENYSPDERTATIEKLGGMEFLEQRVLKNVIEYKIATNIHVDRLTAAKSELEVEVLAAEVLWGDAVTKQIMPLYKCIGTLRNALRRQYRELEKGAKGVGSTVTDEERANDNRIIYDVDTTDDVSGFTVEVTTAIADIREWLKPYLEA